MASGVFSCIRSLSSMLLQLQPIPGIKLDASPTESAASSSVRKDLEKLSRMLARIQAVQQAAENWEIRDESVQLWLAELRGVAYQAEDLLDEYYYEVLSSIVQSGDVAIANYHRDSHRGTKRKFAEMPTSSFLASLSSTVLVNTSIPYGMAEKIMDITERFVEISDARRDLHLREEDGTRQITTSTQIRQPTSSHVDERAIFGRKEEREKIISLLNPLNGSELTVLPIVGMGGLGKTTLAQFVYNDSRVHEWFDKRGWVSVSQNFDLIHLTKAVIESIIDSPCMFSELNKLQDVLKEKIKAVSLFLVLDDVWNDNRNIWEHFQLPFNCAKIVRILVTTRNSSVAKVMQTTSSFQLGFLPEEKCWSLFKHFAFLNKEAHENAKLSEIGRGIVRKCKGSPLALKVLGSMLRYEMDEEKWKEVLKGDISEVDESDEIMPALQLSYQKLPLHLKPCFLFLSMFPKGKQIDKHKVVRFWIAHGYINSNSRSNKSLEDTGSEYFKELEARSLIDCWNFNGYYLHDLIHDLARSICQGTNLHFLESDQQWNSPYKIYHLYMTAQDKLSSFLSPNNYRALRTLVKHCPYNYVVESAIISKNVCLRALELYLCHSKLPESIGTLKHLRYLSVVEQGMGTFSIPESICLLYNLQSLDLESYNIVELPEKIKDLVNLRYLRLCSSKIEQLPESICLLGNLHTLSLECCDSLKRLPRSFEYLTNLSVLKLSRYLFFNLPYGIGKLPYLKPFNGAFNIMGDDEVERLGELKNMNKLNGTMCISGLRNISDAEYCRKAKLASKSNLSKIIFNFEEDDNSIKRSLDDHCAYRDQVLSIAVTSNSTARKENDEKKQEDVLEFLQPHNNLRVLKIFNYGGRTFPSWLLNSLLPKLTHLTLNFQTEPESLPPFGQLVYLKFLKISGGTGVRNSRDRLTTYSLLAEGLSNQRTKDSFLSLEMLSIRNILNLVEWQAHDGDFPCLKELNLHNCPNLRKLPTIPKEVRMLLIRKCGCHEIQFDSKSKIQDIWISNCRELISVSSSLCGNLPALVRISIQDCPRLCKFTHIEELPVVESISLVCCPELWIFPTIPEKLKVLMIQKCGFHEIMLPSRCRNLTISNCLHLISINWRNWGFINEVSFEYCPKLKLLTIPVEIMKLKIHNCGFCEITLQTKSENLIVTNCLELILINWKNGDLNPVNEITVENCPELKLLTIPSEIKKLKVHKSGIREIMFLSISENLTISNCLELILINWRDGGLKNFIGEVTLEYCPKLRFLHIPAGIMKLKIHECGFSEIMFWSVYVELNISNCVELISINSSNNVDLKSIEEVTLQYCPRLEILNVQSVIKKLKIHECRFQEIMFPSRSKNLTISNCLELISIAWRDGHLNFIEEVTLEYCPKLKLLTIPIGVKILKIAHCGIQEINFPSQSGIEMVGISYCKLLTSIHWVKRDTLFHTELLFEGHHGIHKELKNMHISYCPILHFPLKDLLHSMTHRAEIYDCPMMGVGERYVYQRDANITELNFFGNKEIHLSQASVNSTIPLLENPLKLFVTNEDSLEVEPLTCPTSVGVSSQCIMLNLTSLVILELSRCKRVISVTGLDNLSSLKRLSISYCPRLCDWNDKRIPLSLIFLELESCDKLSSLPLLSVENQPSTLKVLVIRNCPVLTILDGFHRLMNLKTVEILHCSNLCIAPGTESQLKPHYITIGDCPLMKGWFQQISVTYKEMEFNPVDYPQDDSETEQASAGSTTNDLVD